MLFEGTNTSNKLLLKVGVDDDSLLVSLSDQGSLHLVGELPDLSGRLAVISQAWQRAVSPRQIGELIRQYLLPERIRNYLLEASAADLELRVSAQLLAIPWELTYDGSGHWFEKFRIRNHLIGANISQSRPQRELPSQRTVSVSIFQTRPEQEWQSRFAHELRESVSGLLHCRVNDPTVTSNTINVVHLVGSLADLQSNVQLKEQFQQLVRRAELLVITNSSDPFSDSAESQIDAELAVTLDSVASLCTFYKLVQAELCVELETGLYRFLSTGEPLREFLRPSGISRLFGSKGYDLVRALPGIAADRELRQVTCLSYDLVGSTEMMRLIGLERYSVSLLDYHASFADIVRKFQGVSDLPQGDDGIMCYFGAVQAHEGTARQAIRAGLAIQQLAKAMSLQVRIGISTGQVAINGTQYVGLTVHLAARIQMLAAPGDILIADSTAALVQSHFALTPIRKDLLKGFYTSTEIFRVDSAKSNQSIQSELKESSFPLIGRSAEFSLLDMQWSRACAGETRWVHLTGEVGIGKTHLATSLKHHISLTQSGQVFVCRNFQETRNRAFSFVIDLLERSLQIQATDSNANRHKVLENASQRLGFEKAERQVLLSLLDRSRGNTKDDANRKVLMRVMTDWLLKQTEKSPVCLIIEDIQWIDPSSLEWLTHLKSCSEQHQLMTLLTERTDIGLEEPVHALADTQLQVQRLDAESVRALIGAIAKEEDLRPEHRKAIERKSDGVPLFIEMSTKMLMEAPQTLKSGEFAIPVTVHDLLMQRLDNLGQARILAQVCSGIGREFSHALMLALCESNVGGVSLARLPQYLDTLLRSGLILKSTELSPTSARYHFRHALVHETAYQSMWEADRKLLHRGIARTIETTLPELRDAHPELLAQHYDACGAQDLAIHWHLMAAKKFKASEAHQESLSHLNAAKQLVGSAAESADNQKTLLSIELTIAGQLIATKGYGTDSAGDSYKTALALAQHLKDRKSCLRAQLGLEAYYLMRADFGQAHAYLSQAQQTALEFDDPLTRAQLSFALANILHHQGHAVAMQEQCEKCLAICRESLQHRQLVQSPEVMSLMYSAVCLWEMGFAEDACARAEQGVQVAESLGQRLAIGQALGMQAMVQLWCGNTGTARTISERALKLCSDGDYDMWSAHAQLIFGACLAQAGETGEGLKLMEQAYASWTATGTIVTRSFYLVLRAQTHCQRGETDAGLRLIAEALTIVETTGERYCEPEVWRIRGDLLLQSGQKEQALQCFKHALNLAESLSYKALALRAAISWHQTCLQTGLMDESIAALKQCTASITQGHQTHDYRVAKTLLTQGGIF